MSHFCLSSKFTCCVINNKVQTRKHTTLNILGKYLMVVNNWISKAESLTHVNITDSSFLYLGHFITNCNIICYSGLVKVLFQHIVHSYICNYVMVFKQNNMNFRIHLMREKINVETSNKSFLLFRFQISYLTDIGKLSRKSPGTGSEFD